MRVYLDNGATTKVDPVVVEAMKPYFSEKYGNASSLHVFGRETKEALENARSVLAKKINAEPDEIVFTSGGTESDNIALKGLLLCEKCRGKNHVITTKIEHPAVLNSCKFLEQNGFKVTYLDVDKDGFINLEQLKKSISSKTAMVSVIHANNEVGTIQDLEKIGGICKGRNLIFHSDVVQSFTKVPIDVNKYNLDLASLSGHKIHGPKGVGAIYVKKRLFVCPFMHGGGHERGLRAGTENIPGIVGFAKAVEISSEKDVERMKELRDYLIEKVLSKIPKTTLNGPRNNRLCNNAHFTIDNVEGEAILFALDEKGIAVSTGSACSSKSLKPSHVLLAMGRKKEESHGSIRITLSKFTTKKEIDYFIENLIEVVANLRKMSPLYKKI
ncbi:cysteine desulfurase NifS [Candidatus Woesearchaeota archaeon]|nr:MAG: cysteine desulfurase NifS [Candidatus Woesearchaeota archaeon]